MGASLQKRPRLRSKPIDFTGATYSQVLPVAWTALRDWLKLEGVHLYGPSMLRDGADKCFHKGTKELKFGFIARRAEKALRGSHPQFTPWLIDAAMQHLVKDSAIVWKPGQTNIDGSCKLAPRSEDLRPGDLVQVYGATGPKACGVLVAIEGG